MGGAGWILLVPPLNFALAGAFGYAAWIACAWILASPALGPDALRWALAANVAAIALLAFVLVEFLAFAPLTVVIGGDRKDVSFDLHVDAARRRARALVADAPYDCGPWLNALIVPGLGALVGLWAASRLVVRLPLKLLGSEDRAFPHMIGGMARPLLLLRGLGLLAAIAFAPFHAILCAFAAKRTIEGWQRSGELQATRARVTDDQPRP
jgi:hypothetical protein